MNSLSQCRFQISIHTVTRIHIKAWPQTHLQTHNEYRNRKSEQANEQRSEKEKWIEGEWKRDDESNTRRFVRNCICTWSYCRTQTTAAIISVEHNNILSFICTVWTVIYFKHIHPIRFHGIRALLRYMVSVSSFPTRTCCPCNELNRRKFEKFPSKNWTPKKSSHIIYNAHTERLYVCVWVNYRDSICWRNAVGKPNCQYAACILHLFVWRTREKRIVEADHGRLLIGFCESIYFSFPIECSGKLAEHAWRARTNTHIVLECTICNYFVAIRWKKCLTIFFLLSSLTYIIHYEKQNQNEKKKKITAHTHRVRSHNDL